MDTITDLPIGDPTRDTDPSFPPSTHLPISTDLCTLDEDGADRALLIRNDPHWMMVPCFMFDHALLFPQEQHITNCSWMWFENLDCSPANYMYHVSVIVAQWSFLVKNGLGQKGKARDKKYALASALSFLHDHLELVLFHRGLSREQAYRVAPFFEQELRNEREAARWISAKQQIPSRTNWTREYANQYRFFLGDGPGLASCSAAFPPVPLLLMPPIRPLSLFEGETLRILRQTKRRGGYGDSVMYLFRIAILSSHSCRPSAHEARMRLHWVWYGSGWALWACPVKKNCLQWKMRWALPPYCSLECSWVCTSQGNWVKNPELYLLLKAR